MSDGESNTLLIFDGHNVALRAYHALSKQTDLLKNKDGEGTWGIYGFFTTLVHFVNRYNPEKVAITFDWGQSEKRLAIFPDYKAHRKSQNQDEIVKRQESRRQVEVLIRLLEVFNIPVIREPNVEADDIIAKLVHSHNGNVVVVSGDHDLRQLVNEQVSIVKPSIGIKKEDIFDLDRVLKTYGVHPSQLVELWSLTGDTSDNIPGIPGIGEKTAATLINQHGDLDAVISSGEPKVFAYEEQIRLAKSVIQLDPQCSKVAIPDLSFKPIKPGEVGADIVLESLEALDFNSIKFKWITGTLWVGNELSVGKPFKKKP